MMTGLRQKKPSGLLVTQQMGRIPTLLFLWCVLLFTVHALLSKHLSGVSFFFVITFSPLTYASCELMVWHVTILIVFFSLFLSYGYHWHLICLFHI